MKGLIIIIFLVPTFVISSQKKEYNDNFQHSLGLGLSNSASILVNPFLSSSSKPSFYLDYKRHIDSSLCFRFGINSTIASNTSKFTLDFNNFYITGGIEKNKKLKGKLFWYYGADLYYKMTLRRYKIPGGASSWTTDSLGLGLLGLIGIEYRIHKYIAIATEFNIGIGLHQKYLDRSFSGSAQEVWSPKAISTRNLSLGIIGYFNSP